MSASAMFLPVLILTAVLGGATYYFAQRFTQIIRYFAPRFPLWVCLCLFALLMLALVAGFFRSMMQLPDGLRQALKVISAYWMGAFVYLLLFFVLCDAALLAGGLFKLIPRPFSPLTRCVSAGAAVVLALSTSLYGFVHAADVRHVSYDVSLPGQAQGMNIVLISDLHLGAVGSEERLDQIIREINALQPDLICMAGDLFDNDFGAIRNPDRVREQLLALRSAFGVYACLGNHDAGSSFHQMTAFLEECGIRLLNEEAAVIDNRLVLAGRLDRSPIGANGGLQRRQMADILSGIDETLPVVVMDHNPARADAYGSEADLILCGHTHKGQIFPGSLITSRMYTVDYGHARPDENGPQVIVTSGVGTWGPPMRVGTDCEIVTIRLVP